MELADAGVNELLDLYRLRSVSPVEVLHACLRRIEQRDGRINAVITVCAERAEESARKSEQRWQRGEARALEGIPFGLKDVIETAGIRTTAASPVFRDHVPATDATVVSLLVDAGAVLVAKLQTFQFALGGPANREFGWTRNPRDESRIAGGSSSGPAAALAAGMLPLAIGTDTGGSIRLPAAYCGIAGLRPTLGRVPRKGVMLLTWTLDTVGPMARSAGDLEPVLRTLAPAKGPVDSRVREFAGITVGVPDNWSSDCDPIVRDGFERSLALLTGIGATVVELSVPLAEIADAIGRTIVTVEAGSLHEELFAERETDYEPVLADRFRGARAVVALDYARALRLRQLAQDRFADMFRGVDLLATPTSLAPAPHYADLEDSQSASARHWRSLVTRMTFPFSLAGVPAISVPAALAEGSPPAGLQLVAAAYQDERLIQFAAAYESARVTTSQGL